jgi:hypothetical protein
VFSPDESQAYTILDKAKNVLLAFSKRNPYVGYCQGLNFIIAEILNHEFGEEVGKP